MRKDASCHSGRQGWMQMSSGESSGVFEQEGRPSPQTAPVRTLEPAQLFPSTDAQLVPAA